MDLSGHGLHALNGRNTDSEEDDMTCIQNRGIYSPGWGDKFVQTPAHAEVEDKFELSLPFTLSFMVRLKNQGTIFSK